MIGVYDYTVILTYLSLASGLLSMVMAYQGNFVVAICCTLKNFEYFELAQIARTVQLELYIAWAHCVIPSQWR